MSSYDARILSPLARLFSEAGTPHVVQFTNAGGSVGTFGAFRCSADAHAAVRKCWLDSFPLGIEPGGVWRVFDVTGGRSDVVTWAARVLPREIGQTVPADDEREPNGGHDAEPGRGSPD